MRMLGKRTQNRPGKEETGQKPKTAGGLAGEDGGFTLDLLTPGLEDARGVQWRAGCRYVVGV